MKKALKRFTKLSMALLGSALMACVTILTGCGGGSGGNSGDSKPLTQIIISSTTAPSGQTSAVDVPITSTTFLHAFAMYSDGTNMEVSDGLQMGTVWSSADTNIATVNKFGNVTAVSGGTTTISAAYGGVTGQQQLMVYTTGIAKSIVVTPANATIAIGGTQQFTATLVSYDTTTTDATNDPTCNWSVKDTTVAVSARAKITGQSAGTTEIQVGKNFSYTLANGNKVYSYITGTTSLTVMDAVQLGTTASSPTVTTINTTATYYASDGTDGYLAPNNISIGNTGVGIGAYITNASGPLTLDMYNSSNGSFGVTAVAPTGTNNRMMGVKLSNSVVKVKVTNSSGSPVTYTLQVVQGTLGDSYLATTSVPISLATPTWVAAAVSPVNAADFSFVAAGSTATIKFENLTAGVDVEVRSSDKSTVVFTKTTDGTEGQLTKTVNVTGLTSGNTYIVRVSSRVQGTNGASVGKLTITSP